MEPSKESKSELPIINLSINLKVSSEEGSKLELVHSLEITEEFRREYLVPYLSSLWESLASRSLHLGEGVPRFAFLEVSGVGQRVVRGAARDHRGASV